MWYHEPVGLIRFLIGCSLIGVALWNAPLVQARDKPVSETEHLSDIATKFAPIFVIGRYQTHERAEPNALCPYNIPTLVNFDGNWDAEDNEGHYEMLLAQHPGIITDPGRYHDLGISLIYYEAISSQTHVFLTYYLFYPHDAGGGCRHTVMQGGKHLEGHRNDATSMMLIVRKGEPDDQLEWVRNFDRGIFASHHRSTFATMNGRPVIHLDNANHYMELSQRALLPKAETHYLFGLRDRYHLVSLYETLWEQRGNPQLFDSFAKGVGIRFKNEEPRSPKRGLPPWAPWTRRFISSDHITAAGTTKSYVDPITAFERLYYNDSNGPYSQEYLHNPYLRRTAQSPLLTIPPR